MSVCASCVPFSHGPTYVKRVEPGSSASVSHGSKSLRKSSKLIVLKDGVFSLGLPSYRSSLYHVAAKKVCGTSALTSDY